MCMRACTRAHIHTFPIRNGLGQQAFPSPLILWENCHLNGTPPNSINSANIIPSTQVHTTFQRHVSHAADITLRRRHAQVPDQVPYRNPQGELLEKPNQDKDEDSTLQLHSYCIRELGRATWLVSLQQETVTKRHTRGACVQREGRVKRQ